MTIVDRGVPAFGQFSPDGRWVAYESQATDDQQIYVVPFPGPGAPRAITTAGGTQVRWGPEGEEIFYIGLDGEFMAVPVSVSSGGELVVGTPQRLFTAPIGSLQFRGQQYDVSADGERFLMYMPREANSAISVLLNWDPSRGF